MRNLSLVKDVTKRLFIIDSPSVDDLKHGLILSDEAGVLMTNTIYKSSKIPFGELIESSHQKPDLNFAINDGILCICPFSLDKEQNFTQLPPECFGYTNIEDYFWKTGGNKVETANYIKATDPLNILKVLKDDLVMYSNETEIEEIICCGIVASAFMFAVYPELEMGQAYTWQKLKVGNKEVKYYGGGSPRNDDWGTTAILFK